MYVTDWTFKYDYIPSRKTAYFTIEKDGMEIDATVKEWLDENLEPTSKSKAQYIKGRGWAYSKGAYEIHPLHFAIKL